MILLSMMIPTSSLVIPMFKMFNSMHLLNTKLGVVLPALSTAFLIFFFQSRTQAFSAGDHQSLPIDGLGAFGIF